MLMSEKYCSFPHSEALGSICLAGDSKWEPRAGNELQMEGSRRRGTAFRT